MWNKQNWNNLFNKNKAKKKQTNNTPLSSAYLCFLHLRKKLLNTPCVHYSYSVCTLFPKSNSFCLVEKLNCIITIDARWQLSNIINIKDWLVHLSLFPYTICTLKFKQLFLISEKNSWSIDFFYIALTVAIHKIRRISP